jgi:hypothetical protein
MGSQQERLVLADLRSAAERLALPSPQQIEWVSRRGVHPEDLILDSMDVVRTAIDNSGSAFSPVLLLRLEALADRLSAMSGEPDAMLEAPDSILRHSSWALVRYLAEAALQEPGWPSS